MVANVRVDSSFSVRKESVEDFTSYYVTSPTLRNRLADLAGLDVLHVVGSMRNTWPMPRWFMEKSSRWTAHLRSLGMNAAALVPQALGASISHDEVFDVILRLNPKMVVSRAFAIENAHLSWLALRQPDVTFIQMNHTPHSFVLGASRFGMSSWLDALDASESLENFWFGSVSSRDTEVARQMNPKARACWIPNPCRSDLYADVDAAQASNDKRLAVGLAGRVNYQKNFKNQLDAIAILARQRPLSLHLFLGHELAPGMAADLTIYAKRYLKGTDAEVLVMQFLPPPELMAYAKKNLDLFLQVTFDESFGYLTWEMMAAGVPTISSESPEFVGVATADPTDVVGIVNQMKRISDDPSTYRHAAIERARQVEQENNRLFGDFFRHHLGQLEDAKVASS